MDKITISSLVKYAEDCGKEAAANLMLLGGADAFDMDYDTYCDIMKILQMKDGVC